VNHRKLLDGMMEICGVPQEKFRTVCSAIDKLDKVQWAEVMQEMVTQKGIAPQVALGIGMYVKDFACQLKRSDPAVIMRRIMEDRSLMTNARVQEAVKDMQLFFAYCDAFGCLARVSFDLSLARGLDYYTGVIFEAVTLTGHVGSIAGGGRYDNLIGMFATHPIPSVGMSVGIERILTLVEKKEIPTKPTKVYVASAGGGYLRERLELINVLWDANIPAEFAYANNPKAKNQIATANADDIPLIVFIGEDELKNGQYRVRDMDSTKEELVSKDEIVGHIRQRASAPRAAKVNKYEKKDQDDNQDQE